ncbi:MAG TPA: sugar diacid recognition domain-containing protein [Spirochaetales bacterium]|nr:sugar diacid recognition domain-containing protein [Spirochaetales bacterium]HRY55620.1 sugar diacid recognition domain-containing protein [Spirochaetia bacterium]HRZ64767.1 sugar diacid recognition domain-containing protein [Spirochaetia bacterium]
MDRTILDPAMAAAFVRRLGERIDYNINIMDRDGVIIASRDQSRLGSYHEAAHRLLESGGAIEAVEPGAGLPAGVRPGVNLPILYKGEAIGVVGVTGEPALVEPVAYAVKTSVETMVELELYKELTLRRQDRKNLLLNSLLYEDEAPRAGTAALAAKLGYDASLPRAPLLMLLGEELDAGESLKAVKRCGLHGPEDLSAVTNQGSILVFKAVELGKGGLVSAFESQVEAYLGAAARALGGRGRSGAPFRAYVGMFQNELGRYRGAYRQALWLSERYPEGGPAPVFLHRRLSEYLASRIPRAELVDAFASLASLLPPGFAAGIGGTIGALVESGFNAKEAAGALGVHRNTLASRLEAISELFGLDPRLDPRGRDLLSLLFRFLDLSR